MWKEEKLLRHIKKSNYLQYVIISILLVTPFLLWPNGGPINESSIIRTGNLHLLNEHSVDLKEEILKIEIIDDYVNVSVKYELFNSETLSNVTYGFPIDVAGYYYRQNFQDQFHIMEIDNNIQDYSIELNGEKLDFHTRKDEYYDWTKKEILNRYDVKLRNWFISNLSLHSGKNTLVISYKVKSMLIDSYYTGSVLNKYSERIFEYILSPSGYWGDGIVDKFKIVIDISQLKDIGGRIIKYPDNGVWTSSDIHEYNFKNINLLNQESIIITYDNSSMYKTEEFKDIIINEENYINKIETSSELQSTRNWSYSKNNLIDNDFRTAWVEGVDGNGIGEEITIYFDEATRLRYLGILNGFLYDEKTYYENSRVKELEVKVSLINDSIPNNQEVIEDISIVQLQDLNFKTYNSDFFGGFVQTLFDTNGFYAPIVTKVELKIIDVYPGEKYNDLCISELLLGYDNR